MHKAASRHISNRYRNINLLIGPLLFFLCLFLLPHSLFTSAAARGAIGTTAWMAYWWVTAPVDAAVTGFLPIAINALFQMCDMSVLIANYADEIILLLLGASIITASWEITGLDRRIASWFLIFIGNDLRHQIIFWFLLSTALSSMLPNAVVCAAITPIAVSMLKYIGIEDIGKNTSASMVLMTIAYGAGVGGLASPLGGAMNLLTVNYIQKISGSEFIYWHWVVRFLPIMIVLIVSNLIYLVLCCKKGESFGGSREYFVRQYRKMGPMSNAEKWALVLFAIATILSFTRQLYQNALPGLKPAYVFIICAILSFIVTKNDGKPLIIWKEAEKKIIWDLLFIFAGGLAIGTLMNESGAAKDIGNAMAAMHLNGGFLTVLVIITVTLLMSDITSNTATAAVVIPIVINIVESIGLDPIPYIYTASIGVNLSYMLPTSIRAIPVGYGLEPRFMLKKGVWLSLIVIVLLSITAWLLIRFWPTFSTT